MSLHVNDHQLPGCLQVFLEVIPSELVKESGKTVPELLK